MSGAGQKLSAVAERIRGVGVDLEDPKPMILPAPEIAVTIPYLEALAKAAVNATTAMDGLTYAMKRQDRLQPQWSLLAIAFLAGAVLTFLLLAAR